MRCVTDACLDQTESQCRTEGHVRQSQGDRVGKSRVCKDVFIQHNDYGRERNPEDNVAATKVCGFKHAAFQRQIQACRRTRM